MRITVIGLGYVGLVTAAGSSEWGHDTVGVDADPARNRSLAAGHVPFHEPGLEPAVRAGLAGGRFRIAPDPRTAVEAAELTFVAVGTHDGDGGWQTATITACLQEVVPALADDAALVIRSTLPPAFIRRLPELVRALRHDAGRPPVPVLLNPEFTKEGSAVRDFLEPDRVVIGRIDDPDGRGVALVRRFYEGVAGPVLELDGIDASLAKLGSNLFLATKISFANELAELCDTFGATVDEVIRAMALDPRIGGQFLRAGVGFGGSCLPHQVTMTVRDAQAVGRSTPLLQAVETVNRDQRPRFVDQLALSVGGDLTGARVALLGLTFKPDTDDLREAPSLVIAAMLLQRGASVAAHDPMPSARRRAAVLVPGLEVCETVEATVAGADVIGLVTEWREYRELDWRSMVGLAAGRAVVDGRNALPAAAITAAGFSYAAFGRGTRHAVEGSDRNGQHGNGQHGNGHRSARREPASRVAPRVDDDATTIRERVLAAIRDGEVAAYRDGAGAPVAAAPGPAASSSGPVGREWAMAAEPTPLGRGSEG